MKVELRGIEKRFGGIAALAGVDLALNPGEVRALLGENGAGKSTLTGVLFGHLRPDAGEILLDGKAVAIRSPRHALELGIGLVHQHFALAPSLTVAENVVLSETRRLGRFDRARAVAETRALAERTGLAIDPEARTGDLPVGVRQRAEILKALRADARVLLLDEPTAVLAPRETEELFLVLERLRSEGRSILFITHKLGEVARIAQRVTILRRGRVVAPDLDARTASREELTALMIGDGSRDQPPHPDPPPRSAGGRESAPALSLRQVTARGADGRVALRDVSLDVLPGEVVGVAGVAGNGQEELFQVVASLLEPESGTVTRRGEAAEIPGDRSAFAIAPAFTCAENLAWKKIARGPLLVDPRALVAHARPLMEKFDVRPPEPTLPVAALSGGNQQKLVLARELSSEPAFVLALDPARGLDVLASEQVARRILEAAARGAGVLLISTDLDEVLALSTRAFALHGGRLHSGPLDRDALGMLMLAGKEG
ncbi:MAG TPA: ABC transporter ATP-binding protein [Planctomycetota bacterium]|nr:ABC transporter ATP-binding protein [Planctomycetota bacterium]